MFVLFDAFVCFDRDVLCDVAWFVLICAVGVCVFFVLNVLVRFACDV